MILDSGLLFWATRYRFRQLVDYVYQNVK